eukprot:2986384-Prymnesium_polylepis.1
MTVEASPSTVQGITALCGVLDSLLERAVMGQQAARSPDRVVRAFRKIRTLVMLKVRLLHHMDKDDCGTDADPLAGFATDAAVAGHGGAATVPAAHAVGVGIRRACVSRPDSPVRHGSAENAVGGPADW